MTTPKEALEQIAARSIAQNDDDAKELRRQLYHIASLAKSALASLEGDAVERVALRRTVLDILNSVAPAVENLACNQEQADMDGCMVKVSRQALDEVLNAINEVAIQAATAATIAPDEAAIRADEREKCAAEVERANWPCVGDARRIAAALAQTEGGKSSDGTPDVRGFDHPVGTSKQQPGGAPSPAAGRAYGRPSEATLATADERLCCFCDAVIGQRSTKCQVCGIEQPVARPAPADDAAVAWMIPEARLDQINMTILPPITASPAMADDWKRRGLNVVDLFTHPAKALDVEAVARIINPAAFDESFNMKGRMHERQFALDRARQIALLTGNASEEGR